MDGKRHFSNPVDETPPRSVAEATARILNTYAALLEDLPCDPTPDFGRDHILWMCRTASAHIDEWPIDKSSRWLGCIQGVLAMKGIIDFASEREATRPLFHAAYASEGRHIPRTLERNPAGKT